MKITNAVKWCIAGLAVAVGASAVLAQKSHPVNDAALRKAASNGAEWLTYGHDDADTHYSPLKQIDTKNASRLGLAWYFQTDSDPGNTEATPIIANGTMYVTTDWDLLYALDARTGKMKWSWDPKIGHLNFPRGSDDKPGRVRTGPSLCCGPGNRGVAIYEGKVYMGTLDNRLIAFDAATGKIDWQVQTSGKNTDYSITGAPRVIRGNVLIGNGGGEYNTRGYVTAYNAETGKLVWRFYTVPGEPANPIEAKAMAMAAKTWKGDKSHIGGGNPWNGISYDPKLNLVYIGTGQGGPWVRKYRSPGGGDNLFICSIVALHADTGKFAWYFQETPDDEWDYDATADIMLANIKIDGKMRQVAMQAPKNGYFYVIDRKTGKFISGAPLVRTTWAKGLDPKTGRPIINPAALYDNDKNGVEVWPGAGGGHVWPGMSFSPSTGLVYIPGMTGSPFTYIAEPGYKYELGKYDFGITFRRPTPPRGAQATRGARRRVFRMHPFLIAWDPATETQRWRLADMGGGGTVTTGGGLVFAASDTGDFEALDAATGKDLWKVKLIPSFGNPVAYSLDGKEYVSVLCGRSGKSRIYTFALGATTPLPPKAFGGN